MLRSCGENRAEESLDLRIVLGEFGYWCLPMGKIKRRKRQGFVRKFIVRLVTWKAM